MLVVVDIGNTNITIGIYKEDSTGKFIVYKNKFR